MGQGKIGHGVLFQLVEFGVASFCNVWEGVPLSQLVKYYDALL